MEHKSLHLDRVWKERTQKFVSLRSQLELIGLDWKNFEIYIQCFKRERQLVLWARGGKDDSFVLLRSFSVCAMSGSLGPKRREGDLQVPEGVYNIDRFNPQSRFHLSLGLNYPNEVDLALGDPLFPGADIFIHGGCQSKGCVALTNMDIEEIYNIVLQVRKLGQGNIRVDLFPFRFGSDWESSEQPDMARHVGFWKQLAAIHDDFAKTKTLRTVRTHRGVYEFRES